MAYAAEIRELEVDPALVRKALKAPYLEQATEYDLINRWRDKADEKALHQLTEAYLRMVIKQAGRFRNYGLPLSDLVQEGMLGILQAASRFDTGREVRFSTYATWWVRSAMQEYVLRNWSIVRSGSSATQKAMFFKLRWLRARIEGKNPDLSPTEVRNEVAAALKASPRDVETMMARLGSKDQSLDLPVGEEGDTTIGDLLPDMGPTPEDIVLNRREGTRRSAWLKAALNELNPRELLIVKQRQLQDDAVTLEEIGQTLGVTKERVRQIEQKALGKLKQAVLRYASGGPGASGATPACC